MGERKPARKGGATVLPLSIAHLAALAALQASAVLLFLAPPWFPLPLAAFLAFIVVAPFIQRVGLFLPVQSRGKTRDRAVSLTFDDGPDPEATPALLDLLAAQGVRAAFFVMGKKAAEHPDLIRRILAEGHEVGNHSFSHDVLLMLRRAGRLRKEITSCQEALAPCGIRPLAFRPPVGVTNPLLFRELVVQGMFCAGFSLRALDTNQRRLPGMAQRVLARVRPGDVVVLHDGVSRTREQTALWLDQAAQLIRELARGGYKIVLPSAQWRRPLKEPVGRCGAGPVRAFYDCLALDYDRERESAGQHAVRGAEEAFFSECLEQVQPGDQVLELGAGTGRFSLPMAGRAESVTAVDISGNMLAELADKAARQGTSNLRTLEGDFMTLAIPGTYDVLTAFSCLEYVADLNAALRRCADLLRPGGRLFFTTAQRGGLRFFVQVGNAMRQGLWLHARSGRQLRRALAQCGFEEIRVSGLARLAPFTRPFLLAVSARTKG